MKIKRMKLKNKIVNGIFMGGLIVMLCSPIVAKATVFYNRSSVTTDYNGFTMTSTCEVKSSSAKATTSGAASPYYNFAAIFTYDKDGNLKKYGENSNGNGSKAEASVSGSKFKKGKSCNMITNGKGNGVGDATETVSIVNTVN